MRRPGPAVVVRHVRFGIGIAIAIASALLPTRAAAQQPNTPDKPPAPEPAAGTPEENPITPIGVPQAAPPPPQPPPPETQPLPPANQPPEPARLTEDTQRDPGYLPGYRQTPSLGLSPWTPSVGALPGGMTPGYGALMPPNEWTFQFTGFMNMSAQYGISTRPNPAPGQSSTVFHVPPQTVEEYQSFVSTATVPGNWVQMNFRYGNRDVSANLTLSTWNPSEPTTAFGCSTTRSPSTQRSRTTAPVQSTQLAPTRASSRTAAPGWRTERGPIRAPRPITQPAPIDAVGSTSAPTPTCAVWCTPAAGRSSGWKIALALAKAT